MKWQFPTQLPPGPLRDLKRELHRLHARAGHPSTRTMEKETKHGRFTIQHIFCSPDLPNLPIMMGIAEYLLSNAPRTDPDEWLDRLDNLWSQAEQDAILDIRINGVDGYNAMPANPPKKHGPRPGSGSVGNTLPHDEDRDIRTHEGGTIFAVQRGNIHVSGQDAEKRKDSPGTTAQAAALPDLDTSRAVILGTSSYQHLPDLPGVNRAVSDLAAALTSPGPLSAHRPTFAADALAATIDAAPLNALATVDEASKKASDALVIYYAGHGLVSQRGELLLATPDSQDDADYTAIRYSDIRELIVRSPAQRKLMILDCCYSGRALGALGTASGLAEVSSAYVLSSTAPYNASLTDDAGMPIFTRMLLDILTQGTPDGPKLLTVSDIYLYIREVAQRQHAPRPMYHETGAMAGRPLALATNRAFRSTPSKAKRSRRGRSAIYPSDIALRVVSLRQDGLSLAGISNQLNAEGVPTPTGRPQWTKSIVNRILHTRSAQELLTDRDVAQSGASPGSRQSKCDGGSSAELGRRSHCVTGA